MLLLMDLNGEILSIDLSNCLMTRLVRLIDSTKADIYRPKDYCLIASQASSFYKLLRPYYPVDQNLLPAVCFSYSFH
jgi:hypothetical protein